MTVVSVVIKAMQWYCFFFKNCVLSRSVLALVSTAGALKFLSAVGKRERGGVCKSEYGTFNARMVCGNDVMKSSFLAEHFNRTHEDVTAVFRRVGVILQNRTKRNTLKAVLVLIIVDLQVMFSQTVIVTVRFALLIRPKSAASPIAVLSRNRSSWGPAAKLG